MIEKSLQQRGVEQAKSTAKNEITSTITCSICAAGYVPSPAHQDLVLMSPFALESAFMSMCHFCFRCRRPACPECWDAVHGVCGACVQEAGLPFRIEVAPMDGVVFPPLRRVQTSQQAVPATLLICVRPGRFQAGTHLSTDPIKVVRKESMKRQSQKVVEEQDAALVEQQRSSSDAQVEVVPVGRGIGVIRIGERVLTWIMLVILLVIVLLIVLAESSPTANAQIMQIAHVDIRSEIGYLYSLIRQIHW